MKKSFVLHHDSLSILKKLSDEQAGLLFKAIADYNINGMIDNLDPLIDLLLTPFISQFERDKEKWVNVAERNKHNGSKGGRPKTQANPENPVGYLETQNNPDKPRKAVNVSDSVSVSVNVNVNDIYTYWNEKTKQSLKGDKTIINNLKIILKTYSVDDVKKVIDYISTSQWHIEKGQVLLSGVSRPTEFGIKLDKAMNSKPQQLNQNLLHRCNDKDYSEVF